MALVTGAGAGLGRAIALALGGAGFTVAVASHRDGGADETVELIERNGGRAEALRFDLADRRTAVEVVDAAAGLGPLTCLVNNAVRYDAGAQRSLPELDLRDLEAMVSANVVGTAAVTQAVLSAMSGGGGRIITLTSPAADADDRYGRDLGYGVAKSGAHRLAAMVAAEQVPGVVAVNLDPGVVATTRVAPLVAGRSLVLTPPEAVGAAVAWLATDPGATRHQGQALVALELCRRHGLAVGVLPSRREVATLWAKRSVGAAIRRARRMRRGVRSPA